MADNKKNDFDFIREKIKEKPLNKKRILKHVMYDVFLAAIFGIVACAIFTILQPVISAKVYEGENAQILIPKDRLDTETQLLEETEHMQGADNDELAENTEQKGTEKESEATQTQGTETGHTVPAGLELEDYQKLQNKLYDIGKEADDFIVTVTGVSSNTDWYNNAYESSGQATGIIIADSGNEILVLTERKVIATAQTISVTFSNEAIAQAKLKKFDGNTGLAVLSVDKSQVDADTLSNIAVATLGNSLSVSQGDIVIAIGSPLGTNYSIATGNITSVNNSINTIDSTYTVFTTDIVGSSKSSGALMGLNGNIVGLVMQDYSSDGEENTLTAISISNLKQMIEMLSNDKSIPYLGLKERTITNDIAATYGLPKGVYITEVSMDSPAMEAGLQIGDIIVEMDGEEIFSAEAYEERVLKLEPGAAVNIAVKRQSGEDFTRVEYVVTAGVLQ